MYVGSIITKVCCCYIYLHCVLEFWKKAIKMQGNNVSIQKRIPIFFSY